MILEERHEIRYEWVNINLRHGWKQDANMWDFNEYRTLCYDFE